MHPRRYLPGCNRQPGVDSLISEKERKGQMNDRKKNDTTQEIFHLTGKRLLDVPETALFLGLKPRTIYNRIGPKAKDPFPVKPKRIGNKILFDIKELERFVGSL